MCRDLKMQMGFEKTARERTRECRTETALKITNPRIAELESSMNPLEMPKKGCRLWQRDRRLVAISIADAFSNSCTLLGRASAFGLPMALRHLGTVCFRMRRSAIGTAGLAGHKLDRYLAQSSESECELSQAIHP